MELEELFIAWKAQDKYIDQNLKVKTFSYLFKQKSKGVLSQIIKILITELIIIFFLLVGFNVLSFIVDMPYSILRWVCFVIFNLITLGVIFTYSKTINQVKLEFKQNVCSTLEQIINNLNHFRAQSKYLNAPIGIICIMMFAGSQDLIYWLPWLILEFFFWRWFLIPKINRRFESYITDLEYSLSTLKEVKD